MATLVQATIASTLIVAIGSFTVIVKIYIFAQCTLAQTESPGLAASCFSFVILRVYLLTIGR